MDHGLENVIREAAKAGRLKPLMLYPSMDGTGYTCSVKTGDSPGFFIHHRPDPVDALWAALGDRTTHAPDDDDDWKDLI
jgi:hypothetical protein